jgi:hypothetical protein
VHVEPVRVANRLAPDCGVLLGASVRLMCAGAVVLAVALAYGLRSEFSGASASAATNPNFASASLESQALDSGDSLGQGFELASVAAPEPGATPASWRATPRFGRSGSALAEVAALTPADSAENWARPTEEEAEEPDTAPDPDDHTAIYDIAAHTVYLPDGRRLEAHSGLGRLLDNPRYVSIRQRGSTPPNVYRLSLREKRFHGVQAIRLTPLAGGRMFGRDGMLAHTYMLGPNGQSNGCVVFSDYPAFLKAYLSGEVNRLVVVDHLENAPDPETAARRVSETVKALLGRT